MKRPRKPAAKWPAVLLASALGGAGGFTVGNEGMVLQSYADPAWGWQVPTACAGDTGPHIRRGMTFTPEQCLEMLDTRLKETWVRLTNRCLRGEVTANEAAAILSWVDNVGVGAACSSTLVRLVNQGHTGGVWCPQLARWVYAKGKKLKGLEHRRQKEMAVCLGESDLVQERSEPDENQ